MKRTVLLLGCLSMMPSGAQSGEFFRWLDAQGRVHYGDIPSVDAVQVAPMKFPGADVPVENMPYETRRAQQNFPVILYVADNCAEYCDQARSLLINRGIPFSENVLKTQAEFDAFKALSGLEGVPVLAVGKTFLKGFQAAQWHSELDIAGYPKTTPYRPASVPPASAPAPASQVTPSSGYGN